MYNFNNNLITSPLNFDNIYKNNDSIHTVNNSSIRNIRSYNYKTIPTIEEEIFSNVSLDYDIMNKYIEQDRFFYDNSKINNGSNNNKIYLFVSDDEKGGYGYKPHVHYYSDNYISNVSRKKVSNEHTLSDEYLYSLLNNDF